MIISHQHRFIFLKTKKVASTSIEIALSELCSDDDIITPIAEEHLRHRNAQNYRLPFSNWPLAGKLRRMIGARVTARRSGYYHHIPAALIRNYLGSERFDSYFKFTVERNPWDRQVSHYHWQTRNDATPPSFSAYIAKPRKEKIIDNYDIYSIDGKVAADFVIRYENLDADFSQALTRAGIGGATPELARTKSAHRTPGDYRPYYNDETRKTVSGWYAREIAEFGYEF